MHYRAVHAPRHGGYEIFIGRHASARESPKIHVIRQPSSSKAIKHGSRIQREPVARRRKSPVNARDLVIPHGRLTRNCVHYRRIRFGSLRARELAHGARGRRVSYTTPKLTLINKYKFIFRVSRLTSNYVGRRFAFYIHARLPDRFAIKLGRCRTEI